MKKLLTGNEAFAYGAYLAGVQMAAAYPGTPSTEVIKNCANYDTIYAEWSPNEKVSLDVATGAAFLGRRSICAMKHVGMNVAADSLFSASYTGMNAGLVIVNADDPGQHSSQNEQDNRNYAMFAKVPMLEPSDSEEAKRFIRVAFDLSEQFDTPVIVRSTTRLSHSRTLVEMEDETRIIPNPEPKDFNRNPAKYVMVPANARQRRIVVEERLRRLEAYAETTELNRIEAGDDEIGIITSGVIYQYAREVFPKATILKLGLVWPLPVQLIRDFAQRVKKLVVIEELDPIFEKHVRSLGLSCLGKEVYPTVGEFNPSLLREASYEAGLIQEAPPSVSKAGIDLPVRPPMLCPGCGHRGLFHALKRLNVTVFGDIGCYTLGSASPLAAMHASTCMGASFGLVHGVDKMGVKGRTVGVMGDSTFFHSGIHPMIDILYNKGISTMIIADNRITAMTGHQENPGSGRTLLGETAERIDIEKVVAGLGAERVEVVNPYDVNRMMKVVKECVDSEKPSVIIARYPCVLHTREKHPVPAVNPEKCNNCGSCLKLGCPPLVKTETHVAIDSLLCNGCGLCVTVCPSQAIEKSEE